jgi:hypothetical protein
MSFLWFFEQNPLASQAVTKIPIDGLYTKRPLKKMILEWHFCA